jgi:hypothetical protein
VTQHELSSAWLSSLAAAVASQYLLTRTDVT